MEICDSRQMVFIELGYVVKHADAKRGVISNCTYKCCRYSSKKFIKITMYSFSYIENVKQNSDTFMACRIVHFIISLSKRK